MRFQNGLGTCRRVRGAASGLVHFQVLALRQQWIGVALIAIELEVGLSCRLANNEHHHGFIGIGDFSVGQFDFLSLLVMLKTDHAASVRDIRPGL